MNQLEDLLRDAGEGPVSFDHRDIARRVRHRRRRIRLVAVVGVVALGTVGVVIATAGDDEQVVDSIGTVDEDEFGDDEAEELIADFLRFANEPSADTAMQLPFAAQVSLGLGPDLHQVRSSAELADPDAWIIDVDEFRAGSGSFSALEHAAGTGETVVSVGEHPHCASPPMPAPEEVADHVRVSVQPDWNAIDDCLQWWTVDLYLNDSNQIEAVTLDVWEP